LKKRKENEVLSLFLQIAFLLIVILLSAKLGGYISIQLGQPAVLGDLIAGVLLGPTVLNLFQLPFEEGAAETIANFGELGVLLLMFLAGLEVHFHELKKNMSVAGLAGLLGVLFPVLFGYVAGSLFGFAPSASLGRYSSVRSETPTHHPRKPPASGSA
jgi:Kef-type K+ transport system membrane component KefB